jgi:hypothetical protein
LTGCASVGVTPINLFDTTDLYELKNMVKVRCVMSEVRCLGTDINCIVYDAGVATRELHERPPSRARTQ